MSPLPGLIEMCPEDIGRNQVHYASEEAKVMMLIPEDQGLTHFSFFPEQVKAQNSYQHQVGEIFILRK